MRQVAGVVLVTLLIVGLAVGQATTSGASQKPSRKRSQASPSVSAQLSQMQRSIDAQQQQIQQLVQQLQGRDSQIQQLQQQMNQVQSTANDAQKNAQTAASQSAQQQQAVSALRGDMSDIKMSTTNTALALQETQKSVADAASRLTLHFRGIDITPGGFLAAESVWRQHGLAADINTPFNSIPYEGASQNNLSEFFGSGRQSRISLLAEGKLSRAKLTGYYEADFLSSGITSNNNESNSYSLRQRQVWGQAALKSGWSFTGGQMWSLVTETRKGLDNRTEAPPLVIDPQYNVGFSWARQYGFRVTKDFSDKFWLGFAVENAQSIVGGHGANNNFLLGAQGTGGGLYNATANYSFNASPDFIVKAAYEPHFGHFEFFGIVSDFRDRIFPCFAATSTLPCVSGSSNPASGAYNNSSIGTGIGANARVSTFNKHIDFGFHFLGGKGIGRYGTAGLPDLAARPDGVLVPLKNYQSLATVETHGKRLDLYFNVGGEYSSRAAFQDPTSGAFVGYGSPFFDDSGCSKETAPGLTSLTIVTTAGTATVPVGGAVGTPLTGGFNPGGLSKCSGDTRNILEVTGGFWYRFYKGPKGMIQWGPQYSWVGRYGWSDKNGLNPQTRENMVFTSFRYYLP